MLLLFWYCRILAILIFEQVQEEKRKTGEEHMAVVEEFCEAAHLYSKISQSCRYYSGNAASRQP